MFLAIFIRTDRPQMYVTSVLAGPISLQDGRYLKAFVLLDANCREANEEDDIFRNG